MTLPPLAGSASVVVLLPITADQIVNWAAKAKLHVTCDSLDNVAEQIKDILEWYPQWALIEQRREPPAPIRDWCNQVSEQANDLLFALGLGPAERGSQAHQNALQHLNPGWGQKDQKDGYALLQLDRLAALAAPEHWRQRLDDSWGTTGRDVFGTSEWTRLTAALRLVESLAARAAKYHARIEAPGGKGRGGARLGLFIDLSRAYKDLFGALPTVARQRRQDDPDSFRNTGPSWTFFRLLLDHVQATALQELERLPPNETNDVRAGWMELVKAASTASGMGGEGDPLMHLLRDSAKEIRNADKRQAARDQGQKSAE